MANAVDGHPSSVQQKQCRDTTDHPVARANCLPSFFGIRHNRGLVTAQLSVVGFFATLCKYFGVNLILPGLRAYA